MSLSLSLKNMDNKNIPIVITGASGWLGQALVDVFLHQQNKLHDWGLEPEKIGSLHLLAYPDTAPLPNPHGASSVQVVDVTNAKAVLQSFTGIKHPLVFHAAGLIHPGLFSGDFIKVNLHGTQHVMEAAKHAQARRVVIMSSNSPVGVNPGREHRFTEDSPYNPYMGYGRSKMLMEQYVRSLGTDYPSWTLVRAPWFYGPFQPLRQKLFFDMILRGKVPIVGDGNNYRSMVFIYNLCQGLVRCAIHDKADREIYWIADETPYTMNEVVDTVETLLAQEFNQQCAYKRMHLPNLFSEIAWLADYSLQKTGFYNQKIHVLSEMNKTIACSISKAQQETGYQPETALYEGMRQSLLELYT